MTSQTFGEFVKTTTRPLLTFTALASWIVFIADGTPYPPAFQWLTVGIVLEWFGERGLTRFTDLMKK